MSLLMLQTCRSCTSFTPSTIFISLTRLDMQIARGVASSRISSVSRISRHALKATSTAIPTERIGSTIVQPVSKITIPATITPNDAPISPTTCSIAPRTFRLCSPFCRPKAINRFTPTAIPAETNMISGCTTSGCCTR